MAAGGWRVVALGVLDGRELVGAVKGNVDDGFGVGKDVKNELLELVAVGLVGLDDTTVVGAKGNLLVGDVERHVGCGLALEEVEGEDVDGDAAELVVELAVGTAAVLLLVRELGVFDHLAATVALDDHAKAFLRVALGTDLDGDVGPAEEVQADEGGVGYGDERVVYLEVEDRREAAFLHVGDEAV